MLTLQDSLVSSSARRLPLRARPDLSARKHRYQGQTYWVIKEPVGLNYFRFQEEEYAILQMLDGTVSLDQVRERFEREFPPEKITLDELQQFIGTLHRSGLVIADAPGQGHQLHKRRNERRRKELLGAVTNILSIRFKGVDPDRFFNFIYPWIRWFFTIPAMICCLLFALSALTLVTVEFDVFQSKLPAFHQFFNVKNAFLLAVALGVTKVLHEFGHGLSCKHFGGECHELGVMVLVLTPCLYCNVSDSWLLPSKWQRAAIGAAGMYVEVVIASICTYIWWFSEPGLLNHLCLSTMFVSSVSTIMFNGNPLLRYDGYYILSDLIEIPNLRQKASDILNRKLAYWCLGIESPEDPFLPQRNQLFFAAYSVAAAAYRWVVALSIMWFLYKVWEPYRLEIIGQIIALAALYGLFVQPIWKVAKFFWVPGRINKVKKPRMYATLALLSLLVAGIFWIPLPNRVFCTFEIQPHGSSPIYIDVPGELEKVHVRPGDKVAAGAPLAELKNLDVRFEIEELKGQQADYKAQYEANEFLAFKDPNASSQLPRIKANLESVEEQLKKREKDLELLHLTAPKAGTVMLPPELPATPDDEDNLPTWSGTPLEPVNRGCMLEEGAMLCQIGDPTKMQAILVVDQNDIEFIYENQEVALKLDSRPGEIIPGRITEIANVDLKVSPRSLSNKSGGELATKTDESGKERPLSTSYQARVPIDDPEQLLVMGLKGRAKIYAGRLTLAQQAWRYLTRTFHFDL